MDRFLFHNSKANSPDSDGAVRSQWYAHAKSAQKNQSNQSHNPIMKRFILSGILLFFSVAALHAQESINAGSGDVAAANLSMSYSIGQAFMEPVAYAEGSVTPGIQQPYKIDVASGVPNVVAELKIQAYPNPATNYLKLSFPGYNNQTHTLRLIDQTGRLIILEKIKAEITRIDVHALASGIYFLQIAEKGQTVKTFKIIKN
jgi:hypothetical protein